MMRLFMQQQQLQQTQILLSLFAQKKKFGGYCWYVAVLETKKLKTFVEVVTVYGTFYPSSWPYSVDKDPRRILQMPVFIC